MRNKIIEILKNAGNVALICHIGPDGDTLGSAAAMREALLAWGKNVGWYCDGDYPHNCRIIHGIEALKKPDDAVWDVCVCIDSSDMGRCGKAAEVFNRAHQTVNIDHHISNTLYADYNLVEDTAATGEIIYGLLQEMRADITRDMAASLYIAISTDTGGFAYSNTTANTMSVAADLVEKGIDVAKINEKLYSERTVEKTYLIGRAIANLHIKNEIAYIELYRTDFEATGAQDSDCEGIIDYARQIEGVEAAFLARETLNNDIKVSLRSNGKVDVCRVAGKFSGGGHRCAAGCTINDTMDKAVSMLLNCIRGELG